MKAGFWRRAGGRVMGEGLLEEGDGEEGDGEQGDRRRAIGGGLGRRGLTGGGLVAVVDLC